MIAILLAIGTSVLINNVVFMRFLGICPFLGVSKKIDSAIGMSVAVIFVMILSTAITYPLFMLLEYLEIGYMSTLAFILVIASLVQFVELVIKKTSAGLYKSLGVYLPLITTNCIILGIAEESAGMSSFGDAMILTIGTGIGFALAMFIFCTIRCRLESANVPKIFKGVPIALITAGLMSLAFLGFSGMIS